MKLLVIIPAYNESESIVQTVDCLQAACPDTDFIVVNDGSKDQTAAICRAMRYPLLDMPVNLGLDGAMGAGMKYAYLHGYDAAVQLDADGQHRPEYIPAMAEKMQEGYDIVSGSRFITEKKPMTPRMLGSRLIALAVRITTGNKLTDPTSGFRMYNRRIIREFAKEINHSPEPDTIAYLMRKGAKAAEIEVKMNERTAGESYFTSLRSAKYMLTMGISIMLVQWFRGGDLPQA